MNIIKKFYPELDVHKTIGDYTAFYKEEKKKFPIFMDGPNRIKETFIKFLDSLNKTPNE